MSGLSHNEAPAKNEDRNQEATVYVGNIDEKATVGLIWELFLQVGPVINVFLPKDRVSGIHQGYGFVEFLTEEDADYAIKILNMIKLFGKPLRINKAAMDKEENNPDVGATLFVGNLDAMVDEKFLYDTFSSFGSLLRTPSISKDPETGQSKGYGFIYFDNFESSDAAIEALNGQFIMNRSISVNYAMKKDGKGERHGTAAERQLAASASKQGLRKALPKNFAELASASGHVAPPMSVMPSMPGMPVPMMQMPPGFPMMPGMPGMPMPPGFPMPPQHHR